MKKILLFPLLALLLSACLPTVQLDMSEPVLESTQSFATVPFGDYETYFERSGSGTPVLLIHGIGGGSSLFQYRRNVEALVGAGYEVYAIDLLGFGRSSRPAMRYTQDLHYAQIESFLETTIARPTVVIANGLSAAYSIRLAANRPELVSDLVLIVPTGYESLAREQNEDVTNFYNLLASPLGEVLYWVVVDETLQRRFLLDAYIDESSLTPEVLEVYDTNLRVPNAKWVVLSFVSGSLDQDVSAYWPEVTQPTLIVWGSEATTTSVDEAEQFLEVRPEVAFLPLERAKLLPQEDRFEAFNEAVIQFLRRN